jgi:hypothetical protein
MGEAEHAGLALQLGRVRTAAHSGRRERPRTAHHETAREQLVAGFLGDRVGLAGEQRLVDLHAGPVGDLAVHHHPVARPNKDLVIQDDVLRPQRGFRAVPHHPDRLLAEHGEAVQRPFGPQLLDHADTGVRDDDQAEQGVLRVPGDQHHRGQGADDGVEPGQHVRADDVRHRPARPPAGVVRLSGRDPLGHLRAGQPAVLQVGLHTSPRRQALRFHPGIRATGRRSAVRMAGRSAVPIGGTKRGAHGGRSGAPHLSRPLVMIMSVSSRFA